MAFANKMIEVRDELVRLGHDVTIQDDVETHASGAIGEEDKWRKMEIDPFKTYYAEINKSDAIIVINITKNSIENYVGGNTLIEMAFAYVLDKKIFLLNPPPKMSYSDEIEAMRPKILNGDLTQIS